MMYNSERSGTEPSVPERNQRLVTVLDRERSGISTGEDAITRMRVIGGPPEEVVVVDGKLKVVPRT